MYVFVELIFDNIILVGSGCWWYESFFRLLWCAYLAIDGSNDLPREIYVCYEQLLKKWLKWRIKGNNQKLSALFVE